MVPNSTVDLSIILTSRNDDHGEKPLQRLQAMIDNIAYHSARLKPQWELVLVEWNPPADRPCLADVLKFPEPNPSLQITIVKVPSEFHNTLRHAEKLPLFQMIAKNAGAAKALGKHFLFTNIDIIFSHSMANFLADIPSVKGVYYRTDRLDIASDFSVAEGPESLLKWAKSHQIRHNGSVGTYPVTADGQRFEPEIIKAAGVTLGKNFTACLNETHPLVYSSAESYLHVDAQVLALGIVLEVGLGPGVGNHPCQLQIEIHGPKGLERKGLVTFSKRTQIFLKYKMNKGEPTLRFTASGNTPTRATPLVLPWAIHRIEAGVGALDSWLQTEWASLNESPDIVDNVVFRGDWHPIELSPNGTPYRWAGKQSQWEIPFPKGSNGGWLDFEVGPGPGTGMIAFWLTIRDESYGKLASFVIAGRRRLSIYVPRLGRDWAKVSLLPTPTGFRQTQNPKDDRVLNFALLGGNWAPERKFHLFKRFWVRFSWLRPLTLLKIVRAFFRRELSRTEGRELPPAMPGAVHMKNCGDFTLVGRDDFFQVGGHSEEQVFSLNLDTDFLYRLRGAGICEVCLSPSMEIYHIEHGSGATPKGLEQLLVRLKENGIPVITLEEVFQRALDRAGNQGVSPTLK